MESKVRDFAPVETVLRAIKPDLDAASLVGIRTMFDPDRHRDVVWAANARDERFELDALRQAINSAAYVRLRHQAARHGIRLPSPAQ